MVVCIALRGVQFSAVCHLKMSAVQDPHDASLSAVVVEAGALLTWGADDASPSHLNGPLPAAAARYALYLKCWGFFGCNRN